MARDLGVSRVTLKKYATLAAEQGYLQGGELPSGKEMAERLGVVPVPPRRESTVSPYSEVVTRLVKQGLEMTAIYARLREDGGEALCAWGGA
jgi:hypothetical protein